jgi:hypothetical protein
LYPDLPGEPSPGILFAARIALLNTLRIVKGKSENKINKIILDIYIGLNYICINNKGEQMLNSILHRLPFIVYINMIIAWCALSKEKANPRIAKLFRVTLVWSIVNETIVLLSIVHFALTYHLTTPIWALWWPLIYIGARTLMGMVQLAYMMIRLVIIGNDEGEDIILEESKQLAERLTAKQLFTSKK